MKEKTKSTLVNPVEIYAEGTNLLLTSYKARILVEDIVKRTLPNQRPKNIPTGKTTIEDRSLYPDSLKLHMGFEQSMIQAAKIILGDYVQISGCFYKFLKNSETWTRNIIQRR
ncbi:Hypothetical protein CINCED_3A003126 [Cinara cedri]|uniref:Uncharacterized protein n=1 Tax=Cinara cedri TaxID=506608 RepID=A0A5E4NAC4_9HEMI|nr:Hypothetical protein CINCED_3A003126 [Cinara cedri]